MMARMARVVVPGYPHHVIQRGVRKRKTFLKTNDYQLYLDLTSEHCKKTGTEVWAYCLMPNHVHLVLVPSSKNGLSRTMSEVHRRYTSVINRREQCTGHLWQERFKSFTMDFNHLVNTAKYIELNPVKAQLCARPEQWLWSSARAHMAAKDDQLVRVEPLLEIIGDWKAYLANGGTDLEFDDQIRQHLDTGRPLGSVEFVSKLEEITGRRLHRKKPGPKSL